MARRVQPQKRGPGGKFVKQAPEPAPARASSDVDDGVPTIVYDDPPKPAAARTAKPARSRTAKPARKPSARSSSRTAPTADPDPPAPPRRKGGGDRPLGFLDGLLGPFGIRG